MNLAKALKLTEKARLPDWEPDYWIRYNKDVERFYNQDDDVYALRPNEAMSQKWEVYTGAKDCRHEPDVGMWDLEGNKTCLHCRLLIKPAYWIVA